MTSDSRAGTAGEGHRLRSDLSRSTPDTITVRGRDLTNDLMGKVDLGEMAFLELLGRLPSPGEAVVFNAMLVSLVEHGITPSTLAARLTYFGAPEALQGAVAAGLLGVGSVFVGTIEGAARIVQTEIPDESAPGDLQEIARRVVRDFRTRRQPIPGVGHPIHKQVDPRAVRLFDLATEHGIAGPRIELIQLIAQEVERESGRRLPVNVTGAIGGIASEMGVPWQICRGLGIMARCIGLVAHIAEEISNPIGREVWIRTEDEVSRDHVPGDGME